MTAAVWRKSRRSQEQGACVEVAGLPGTVAVRDSTNPTGPVLALNSTAFADMIGRIRAGQHDL